MIFRNQEHIKQRFFLSIFGLKIYFIEIQTTIIVYTFGSLCEFNNYKYYVSPYLLQL